MKIIYIFVFILETTLVFVKDKKSVNQGIKFQSEIIQVSADIKV